MSCRLSGLLLSLFIVLLILIPNLYAQFTWKVSAESGYFSSSGEQLQNKSDVLNRMECQSGYKHHTKNNLAKINLKIKPEFYGFRKQLFTFKFFLSLLTLGLIILVTDLMSYQILIKHLIYLAS